VCYSTEFAGILRTICWDQKGGKQKPPAFTGGSIFLSTEYWVLSAEEQHSVLLLFTHRTIEQLIVFEVDLDERRSGGDSALDERFR